MLLMLKVCIRSAGIDQIAGPTEIALIIDESADLDAIAYDVFAQAEHDEMVCTYVISENEKVLNQLNTIIQKRNFSMLNGKISYHKVLLTIII